MQSQGNANHYVSIGLNFGILLISVGPTWYVLSGLEKSHEVVKTLEDESQTSTSVDNEEEQVGDVKGAGSREGSVH